MFWRRATGLTVLPAGPSVPEDAPIATEITEEAALAPEPGEELRVTVLVEEGQRVAQGAPVLASRHHPEIVWAAPMAARVASVDLAPGRRLTEMRFFREEGADRQKHAVEASSSGGDVRRVLLESALWLRLRSRPFGRTPLPGERPAAIFVCGLETRPLAPDPGRAIRGREEDVGRGLSALLSLTDGTVFLCEASGTGKLPKLAPGEGRLRRVDVRPVHPWGLPGFLMLEHHPAAPGRTVWDIHLEDVADIGAFLDTGLVPETRLVSVAGPAAIEARLVRCQPGADLRRLVYGYAWHGPHVVASGSPLDGRPARWLGARDRQVSVLAPDRGAGGEQWFLSALHRASRPLPFVQTPALERAFGGALPAAALLRALATGDRETAVGIGALSLVPEDLALADYVTCAKPRFSDLLVAMLHETALEEAA